MLRLFTAFIFAASTVSLAAETVAVGNFTGKNARYTAGGQAIIDITNGQSRLFLKDFNVLRGPDLEVWLSKGNASSEQGVRRGGYVSLGLLKSFRGDQTYNIPASIDPREYDNVVIWCEDFGVLFAYAPL